ncbi:MAG: amidase, partial [Blastocatellia bacterium]
MRLFGEDILYLPVRELSAQIKSGKLSPVQLTESYLDRGERIGPKLNAYVTITRDLAMKEAHQAEREIKAGKYRGLLHGIPYAAKDLLAVKGYPTTWGAKPLADQTFDYDATVITRLRAAGAVLLGKAAMIELAGGMGYRFASASATGPAKNPWNQGCWTCGSSSGSGAITAAALAPFAIGTETWGSIICPSSYCGVSGLRPTYGRVSRHGGMALAFTMDKIGVLGRTADDCAIVLEHIAGHDELDPSSLPGKFTYDSVPSRRPLSIGLATNAYKDNDVQPGVREAVKTALAVLESHGASLETMELPEGPW